MCMDLLPTRVLQEAAHEIAPILQVIFKASIDRSEVLKDWCYANIIAVNNTLSTVMLWSTEYYKILVDFAVRFQK